MMESANADTRRSTTNTTTMCWARPRCMAAALCQCAQGRNERKSKSDQRGNVSHRLQKWWAEPACAEFRRTTVPSSRPGAARYFHAAESL